MLDVHEYMSKNGKKRFVIAEWDARTAQYIAPMDSASRRDTGCHSVFADSIAAIVNSGNVQTYSTRVAAKRALAKLD